MSKVLVFMSLLVLCHFAGFASAQSPNNLAPADAAPEKNIFTDVAIDNTVADCKATPYLSTSPFGLNEVFVIVGAHDLEFYENGADFTIYLVDGYCGDGKWEPSTNALLPYADIKTSFAEKGFLGFTWYKSASSLMTVDDLSDDSVVNHGTSEPMDTPCLDQNGKFYVGDKLCKMDKAGNSHAGGKFVSMHQFKVSLNTDVLSNLLQKQSPVEVLLELSPMNYYPVRLFMSIDIDANNNLRLKLLPKQN